MNARELAMRGISLPFRATGAVVNKGLLNPLARATRIPLQKAAKRKFSGKTYDLQSGPGPFDPDHIQGWGHKLTVNRFAPKPSLTLRKGYQPTGEGFDLDLTHDITPRRTDMHRRTKAMKKYDEGLFQAPPPPTPRPMASVQRPKVTQDYFVDPYRRNEPKGARGDKAPRGAQGEPGMEAGGKVPFHQIQPNPMGQAVIPKPPRRSLQQGVNNRRNRENNPLWQPPRAAQREDPFSPKHPRTNRFGRGSTFQEGIKGRKSAHAAGLKRRKNTREDELKHRTSQFDLLR